MPPQSLWFLDVDELNADTVFVVTHDAAAQSAEHQSAPDRWPHIQFERRARNRDVDDLAIERLAAIEDNRLAGVSDRKTLVAALFDAAENIAIDEPGQLRRELFPFVRGHLELHREPAFEDADDAALKPPDVIEINDDPLAFINGNRRTDGRAADGYIVQFAGIFVPVRAHEAAEQRERNALVSALIR